MKKGPIILIGIGILIALVASIGSFNWLKAKAQSRIQVQETVDIAVSAIDIPWGTVLTRQMIRTMPYLKTTLPVGYHTSINTLEGRIIIYPLKQNTPVLETSLAPKDIKAGGMAAIVSPKKRAMTVKVDKVIGVSGFIFPGNRVDVLVTTAGDTREDKGLITKIILQNIRVLASGPEVEKTGKQERPSTVDAITLDVTPEEGEKLALAATEGKIQLALRNFTDGDNVSTKGVTFPDLLGSGRTGPYTGPSPEGQKTAPAYIYQSKPHVTVELIQGNKVSSVEF